MSELKKTITEDMKAMLRAKDAEGLKAIRMLLGEIRKTEIDTRSALDDAQILAIVQKIGKRHQDSIAQFAKAGREDLVAIEKSQLAVVRAYLPKQMDEEEIRTLVEKTIAESENPDIGSLMRILREKLQNRADLALVAKIVKEKLSAR